MNVRTSLSIVVAAALISACKESKSGGNESDPLFAASPVAGVTQSDLDAWAAAASWGDHALGGYLTTELNADLTCAGCVGLPELGFDPATQAELDAAAAGIPKSVDGLAGGTVTSAVIVTGSVEALQLKQNGNTVCDQSGNCGGAGGPAGGVLTGTYPNPGLADGAVGPAQLGTIPATKAVVQAGVTVAAGATAVIPFVAAQYDRTGMFSDAVPTRISIATPGIYHVEVLVNCFTAGATVTIGLRINASATILSRTFTLTGKTPVTISDDLAIASTAFLELSIAPTGGDCTVDPGSTVAVRFVAP